MQIGILDLQGDVEEHFNMALRASEPEDEVLRVKKAGQIGGLDALIIPGGESTTLARLMLKYGIDRAVEENRKLAIFGTCAGAILLSRRIEGFNKQFTLKKMDITVERNAFGRQLESFEAELDTSVLGGAYHAVFIRAPVIKEAGKEVEILGKVGGRLVLAREGKNLACSFHPELSGDTRLHSYFFELARG